jgi:4-amino-4-deoxy-L-arabinose transferase-like glycosyltransferase
LGKDEYGTTLPVVLRSFDDYKPALYAYLSIPFIAAFGLNVFAVRFVSALFGVATVIVFYFLVKKLTKHEAFSLAATLLLAISPWHLQFSRTAFEANLGLSLIVFTAYFFLKGIEKHWYLSLSAFFAGLSLYAYQSEKVFTPLFVILLMMIYFRNLILIKKKFLITALLGGMVTLTPFIVYTFQNPESLARAKGTMTLMTEREKIKNDNRYHDNVERQNSLGRVIDSRFWVYGSTVVSGYFSHFDPKWLFLEGDNPRHHAPHMGVLYFFEFPLLMLGIYFLFFDKKYLKSKSSKLLVAGWLLLSPLAPSVTNDVPHAVRSLTMLPMIELVVALGGISLFSLVKNTMVRGRSLIYPFVVVGVVIVFFNVSYYLDQYYVQAPYFNAKDWQYGYKDVVAKLESPEFDNQKVVVSDVSPMDQSYIFFLFYTKFDPTKYQSRMAEYEKTRVRSFDKYIFRKIEWEVDAQDKNTIYAGSPNTFSGETIDLGTAYYPDGTKAIQIVRPL